MASPRRNVELKAVDPDPAATLAAALALGAQDCGELVQRDTYFVVPGGRLKLREQAGEAPPAQLVAYARRDDPAVRVSEYRLAPVQAAGPVRDALGAALGVGVVVAKRRRLLVWRSVRIHLDEVEGLGRYVELEAVAAAGSGLAEERARVAHLRAALGITDDRLREGSYADALGPQPEGARATVGRLPEVGASAGPRSTDGPEVGRAWEQAARQVADRAPGARPRIGLVLGSGLGAVAEALEDVVRIPYAELAGFREGTVAGHAGELVLGRIGEVGVACLSGRAHRYEGATAAEVATPIRTLKALGVGELLLTNASGSLRPQVGPGSLVALTDHVNLLHFNPLTGPNDDALGPRFPAMAGAYDAELRARLHAAAAATGTELSEGVYLATPGPSFETAAEIRAFRTLGADLVGMSTVPEVIVARHAGLRVAAVSVVTNLAEGMQAVPLSHASTLAGGAEAAGRLAALIARWVRDA